MSPEMALDSGIGSSVELARRLHDTIAQRLTGLSCFLGDAGGPVPDDALERCRDEIHAAIDELREALDSVGRGRPARTRSLDAEVAALRCAFPGLDLDWRWTRDEYDESASLIDSFLVEALCNVGKHARPTRVIVEAQQLRDAIVVSVRNDGVRSRPGRGTRQGSRLLALEATAHGAITESHAEGLGHWRQQLIMPCRTMSLTA
jgi:signal transduction histidine kinase